MSLSTFEYVKDALKYKTKGNFALAETALMRALQLEPTNITTLNELALLKMDLGQNEEALTILNEILESKQIPISLFRKSDCLFRLGRENEALNELTTLELLQFDFPGAWALRSDIYLASSQPKEALSCIDTEIKHRPDQLNLYYKRANIYLELKKRDLALADYKKIALVDYKNVKAYLPYVEALVEDENYIEANTFLKQSKLYGRDERLDELDALVIEKLGLHLH